MLRPKVFFFHLELVVCFTLIAETLIHEQTKNLRMKSTERSNISRIVKIDD